MVSFRFHIVSLVSVFLALALGIGMGVTVIDKATVDLLQKRLDTVRDQVNEANQRSDALDHDQSRSADYESRAQSYVLQRQLNNVPVLIVAFHGTDQGPINDLKKTIESSGALVQGTLWFEQKDKLDNAQATAALAANLGSNSLDSSQVLQTLLARVNAVLAGVTPPASLSNLINNGYLGWEGDVQGDITKADFDNARLVVASGPTPDVSNDQLAIPFVRLLASQPVKRVVAVESGRDPDAHTSGERAIFLGPIRSDGSLNGKLSTVDNIEVAPGQVATVLALAQLPQGRTGDYGYGSGTDGAIPKLQS